MKVEKKTKSFYFLGYLLELIIKIWRIGGQKKKKKKTFKVWRIWVIFSTKNPLYRLQSYFSGPVQKTLWGPLLRTLHWEQIGNSHVIVTFEHNVLGTHMYIEIESLPPPLLTPPTNCLPQENQLGLGKRDLRSAVLELHFLGYFCHQRWHCLPNDRD
jgi:hypothetical protein